MGRIVRRESASWLFRFGLLTAISWLQGLCARLVNRLLLAHRAGVFDPFLLRERNEFGWCLGFEVLKFYFPHWGGPVE